MEKLRYNMAYEFLLPKGYQTCDSIPEVLSTPAFRTKCQVRDSRRSAVKRVSVVGCVVTRSPKGKYVFPLRIGTKT